MLRYSVRNSCPSISMQLWPWKKAPVSLTALDSQHSRMCNLSSLSSAKHEIYLKWEMLDRMDQGAQSTHCLRKRGGMTELGLGLRGIIWHWVGQQTAVLTGLAPPRLAGDQPWNSPKDTLRISFPILSCLKYLVYPIQNFTPKSAQSNAIKSANKSNFLLKVPKIVLLKEKNLISYKKCSN